MVKVINQDEFDAVKNSDLAVVDFSAVWCGPCKMVAPVLEEVSEELTDVEFFNIDVDKNMDIAQEYKITNIPAILVLKKGEIVNSQIGFAPKDKLIEIINSSK
ncbi:MAG: thioredoxin [Lachnospiraceae bacterium]|nr:thioredoxin [Lachnospiraceae bacterium]